MPRKIIIALGLVSMIISIFSVSGCTTANSRRQNQRLEELERRVSKMEFEYSDGEYSSSSDEELMKYRRMAAQQ